MARLGFETIKNEITSGMKELDANRGVGLDLVRIYLGFGLFVRGILFVTRPDVLLAFIDRSGHWGAPMAIAHYVAMAHFGGGLLLILGLLTRLAALAQVPALLGAVFFVHWGEGLLGAGQTLELAGIVLFLLVVFTVFGSGPLSVDAYLRKKGPGTITHGGHDSYAH